MSFTAIEIWSNNNSILNTLEGFVKRVHSTQENYDYVYVYAPKKEVIDLDEAHRFLSFLHTIPVLDNGTNMLPIVVDLNNKKFIDKLVYIIFETIIYYLTAEKHWAITIAGKILFDNCSIAITESSLVYGNWGLHQITSPKFRQDVLDYNHDRETKYKYNRISQPYAFTRFFVNQLIDQTSIDSSSSDMYSFLTNSIPISRSSSISVTDLALALIEIKDNCFEHARSPYFYDIDIKEVIHGEESIRYGKPYTAINIAIWDLSGGRLGTAIQNKILKLEQLSQNDPEYIKLVGGKGTAYEKLITAHKNHVEFWSDRYDENDFFALSAFQPSITGRTLPENTGGIGLTNFVEFLRLFNDTYKCYCLSGNTIINLNKSFINGLDKDRWYSFSNKPESLFTEDKPSDSCISKSKLYFPGTAFFVHLEINQ